MVLIGRTEVKDAERKGGAEQWQQVELTYNRYDLETTSWSSWILTTCGKALDLSPDPSP